MIGVAVAAAVLILLPLVEDFANVVRGARRRPGRARRAGSSATLGATLSAAGAAAMPRQVHRADPGAAPLRGRAQRPPGRAAAGGSRRRRAELGGIAMMQIAADQGALMTLLVRAIGARRALEVGTFTGLLGDLRSPAACPTTASWSAASSNEEWAGIARRYFEQAGLAERIDLRLGPALETLRAMPADEPFDFAFIDADKAGYPDYYEETLPPASARRPGDARQRASRGPRPRPGATTRRDRVIAGAQRADRRRRPGRRGDARRRRRDHPGAEAVDDPGAGDGQRIARRRSTSSAAAWRPSCAWLARGSGGSRRVRARRRPRRDRPGLPGPLGLQLGLLSRRRRRCATRWRSSRAAYERGRGARLDRLGAGGRPRGGRPAGGGRPPARRAAGGDDARARRPAGPDARDSTGTAARRPADAGPGQRARLRLRAADFGAVAGRPARRTSRCASTRRGSTASRSRCSARSTRATTAASTWSPP